MQGAHVGILPRCCAKHTRVTLTVALWNGRAVGSKDQAGAPHMQALAALPFPPTCSDAALLSECAGGPCALAAAALAALATLAPRPGKRCSMVVPLLLHDLLDLQENEK